VSEERLSSQGGGQQRYGRREKKNTPTPEREPDEERE
jgi:hypothetical protein